MPRTSRKNIISSYIHVITQGINKEEIFKKSEYKNYYIKLLKEIFQKNQELYLLCYCIMDNHAHLLIYTKECEKLSKAMSRINTTYGIFYNKRENRVGYVFRNRYYTQSIKDESHLHNAIAYIHRNPVKAKLVNELGEYPYSSYQQYQKGTVDKKCIELLFHTQDYKQKFNLIHRYFEDSGDIFDIEEIKTSQQELEKFVKQYCQKLGIKKDEIKRNNYFIIRIMKRLKEEYSCNNKEIAEVLGIGKNRIVSIIKKEGIEGVSPNP